MGQLKRSKAMSTRQSYIRALKAAGLPPSASGYMGQLKKGKSDVYEAALPPSARCILRFGERDIGLHIDEQLGLEEGTYSVKKSPAEEGSETTYCSLIARLASRHS
jgi:hypothetical protein